MDFNKKEENDKEEIKRIFFLTAIFQTSLEERGEICIN